MAQIKKAVTVVTDSMIQPAKPNVEDYGTEGLEAAEKQAERDLAEAKKKLHRQSRDTLNLLAEARQIREELDRKEAELKAELEQQQNTAA